ncbi:NADH:flavin oxidoreductase/NADH oxidase [Halalkalibacter alkaliphilus]|uniref:NADH:flavin oxidoreductase/NADH oxidase n=1 Tax=Halalkalibacter alkaliphilus TaxID=2917993 RepID=A0A9X2I752_9BACI|nr:NADH:flavin oxidoreductase/NADH oxidase [Halalkalibacter alkaliphilus]MCL7749601.1 NADH:flavin oxidoreductase/NADH oxidase [Halalkalibacter alkaliphilus]
MTNLFSSFSLNGLELTNRIMMSPMCQYQVKQKDGCPTDWHYTHYTSRAIGGTGLVFFEMTNVEPRGRITEHCLTLYSKEQVPKFKRIVDACHEYGAKVGLQIAHAGRKSTIKGSDIVGPSSLPFSPDSPCPRALMEDEIKEIVQCFAESASLAVKAGFDTIELHGAHGYLLHQFMSPVSNKRKDKYGEYTAFPLEVIKAVRASIPSSMPLIMRVSAREYGEQSYDLDHVLSMIPEFIKAGVDAFDVSTGGNSPVRPEVYPGYQVKYAKKIKEIFGIPVIAVGRLENPDIAEKVIRDKEADIVAIGRGMLRSPYWAKEASLHVKENLELPGVYDMGYSF